MSPKIVKFKKVIRKKPGQEVQKSKFPDFQVNEIDLENDIDYKVLKIPKKKKVFTNRIRQLTRKINERSKNKRIPTSDVQSIINVITRNKMKDKVDVVRYLKTRNLSKEEVDFYLTIASMKLYNKRLYIPKTLCVKPIEVYYYSPANEDDKVSYFTNDMLYWGFKYKKLIETFYENNFKLIDKCLKIKNVSLSVKNFRLEDKDIDSGYVQDYSDGVSFPCYEICPEDVRKFLLSEDKMNDQEIEVKTDDVMINGVNYKVRYVDQYVLIYKASIQLKDVEKIITKQQEVVYRSKNEFVDGLKTSNVKDGIYYLEVNKINLTNFCPSVLMFSMDVEVPYEYLITCEVDISKFCDILYNQYHKPENKTEKKLIEDKIKRQEREELLRKQKYSDIKKIRRVRKEQIDKINKEEKNQILEEEDEYVENINPEELMLDKFDVKTLNERDIIPLESDFIFWDNIPSCFEFIGIMGYTGGFNENQSTYMRYIYSQYMNLKELIEVWSKCYDLFRKIVTTFYDSCSNKLGYDKLMRIKNKIERFIDMHTILVSNKDTYDRIVKYVNNIAIYANMMQEFVCSNNAYELVNLISFVLDKISLHDSNDMETNLRSVGLYCLSTFVNGSKYMIPEIRCSSAFLGNVLGTKSSEDLNLHAYKLMESAKKKERKRNDNIDKQFNIILKVDEGIKKILKNQLNNTKIKDKDKFINNIMANQKIKEELLIEYLNDNSINRFKSKNLQKFIEENEKNEVLNNNKIKLNIDKQINENKAKMMELENLKNDIQKNELEDTEDSGALNWFERYENEYKTTGEVSKNKMWDLIIAGADEVAKLYQKSNNDVTGTEILQTRLIEDMFNLFGTESNDEWPKIAEIYGERPNLENLTTYFTSLANNYFKQNKK